ncbi:MAG: SIMPL domain-containing protein [Clostridiales bacterium]|nr:SIMPL domain-containing protein [Clostridiales bacterium]
MQERLITVTETASEKFPADYVNLTVTACAESKLYGDASDKAEEKALVAVKAVKAVGIDMRASGISVGTLRDGKKITGYRATRLYTAGFYYDSEVLSRCLEAVSSSECEFGVSFSLKDKSAAEKMKKRAVTSARESAQIIASAAGVKLGKLVKAEYTSGSGGRVMYMRASLEGSAYPEPEDISVSETVTCSFEIE